MSIVRFVIFLPSIFRDFSLDALDATFFSRQFANIAAGGWTIAWADASMMSRSGELPNGTEPGEVKFAKRPRGFANLKNDVSDWYAVTCVVDEREFAGVAQGRGMSRGARSLDFSASGFRFATVGLLLKSRACQAHRLRPS
jgi:hypothetical protein